jgi:hypothetical protein
MIIYVNRRLLSTPAQESEMDWLEASALFLLGWFGRKLKGFAEGVLDIAWSLVRCTPAWRCYFFTKLFIFFLEEVTALRKSGRLNEESIKLVHRFIDWAHPKLKAWQERVRPDSDATRRAAEESP